MSKYTTGEIANLCGVSVRTVQYYDQRGILVPEELSDGGRRIYSEDDLRRMKIICFLRELGLPIDSIKKILAEKHPEKIVSLLLDEQQKELTAEIGVLQERQSKINELRDAIKKISNFSVESIADIAHIMENKRKMRRLRCTMLTIGIIMDIIEVSTIILWIDKGIWLPFAIGLPIVVALGVYISAIYYKKTAYICPECHTVFKPRFKEMFWAMHTPNTRRLRCTACGHHGFCVETWGGEMNDGTAG